MHWCSNSEIIWIHLINLRKTGWSRAVKKAATWGATGKFETEKKTIAITSLSQAKGGEFDPQWHHPYLLLMVSQSRP